MSKVLEIAVFSPEGALIAAECGADRIELCSGYVEGGLTPTAATIQFVKQAIGIPVQVMIRPRGGNFCFSEMEKEIMFRDMALSIAAGADGIVTGALMSNGMIDDKFMQEVMYIAEGRPVTFHRAFDVCIHPQIEIKKLIAVGVKRVLTSAQEKSAAMGIPILRKMHENFGKEITILVAGGLNPANITAIASQTTCDEFHASARKKFMAPDSGFGIHVLPDPDFIREMNSKLKA
ncbi:MAG TPA: copper homeostasis protein CutC [Bacteroidia bacterium]|nr:copper homeostasis protein CutC [Bacteroidia bacterium]